MKLWSLVLKKKEQAEFTFIERTKPSESWFYNTAFDTAKNSIPVVSPSIQPIVLEAEKLCKQLHLFQEELPDCCIEDSVMIRRGYETLVCIAQFEAFEAMVKDGTVKIRTNRYFFSEEEMKAILNFIDVVINQGWFE